MPFLSQGLSRGLAIRAHPRCETGFIERPRSQAENRLRGSLLAGGESIAVQFEEQHANQETGAFVSVQKRVIANNAGYVSGRHLHKVRLIAVGAELPRPREGGFQQACIAHARRAAVQRKQTPMKRQGFALFNPYRWVHLESACSVLR